MSKNNYPIDFVLIWVDGNDPEWQKEKARYSGEQNDGSDARDCRYRDWDNLRYWFRGVEKFAPWVNKIYFVTCGHVPEWLNLSAEKLCFVKHSDYIPEEYLPTFSANPIELNLHRIEKLQEHFVFFNDDTFLLKPTNPDIFFRDGLPVLESRLYPIRTVNDSTFPYLLLNDTLLINRHFSLTNISKANWRKWLSLKAYGVRPVVSNLFFKRFEYFPGFTTEHLPAPTRKSTIKEIWELEGELLSETSKHKFRDRMDVNQYIFKYWQLAKGEFSPSKRTRRGRYYSMPAFYSECCQAIVDQKYPMICINDFSDAITEEQFEDMKRGIVKAFSQILPEKSNFEI